MRHRTPETKAQQFSDEIFNGTGAITTLCQDLIGIADAMVALGLPAGTEAFGAIQEIRQHARDIASAFGGYVGSQANGTLYHAPEVA
ncbi:MAG: hypothetical protein JWR80_10026 [Bradyrhizobium sp.]|nr:hypothetical protein [Bradyrhizobium sp.]